MYRLVQTAVLFAQIAALQAENARLRDALTTCRGHLSGTIRAASTCLSGVDESLEVCEDLVSLSWAETVVVTDGAFGIESRHRAS